MSPDTRVARGQTAPFTPRGLTDALVRAGGVRGSHIPNQRCPVSPAEPGQVGEREQDGVRAAAAQGRRAQDGLVPGDDQRRGAHPGEEEFGALGAALPALCARTPPWSALGWGGEGTTAVPVTLLLLADHDGRRRCVHQGLHQGVTPAQLTPPPAPAAPNSPVPHPVSPQSPALIPRPRGGCASPHGGTSAKPLFFGGHKHTHTRLSLLLQGGVSPGAAESPVLAPLCRGRSARGLARCRGAAGGNAAPPCPLGWFELLRVRAAVGSRSPQPCPATPPQYLFVNIVPDGSTKPPQPGAVPGPDPHRVQLPSVTSLLFQ